MNRLTLQVGWAVCALAILGVTGCRNKTDAGEVASVRLINAVPDAGGLDVSVNGRRVWKRATFRSSTGYQSVASGTYPVTLDAAGLGTTLLTQSLAFDKGRNYTLLALGQAEGRRAKVQILPDEQPAPLAAGKASVRLVNASPGTAVDLVVNTIVGVKSVGYGRRSEPLVLSGGDYELQLAAAGTARMLVEPVHLSLAPGRRYTLIAMGKPGSRQSLSLEAYPDK